MNERIRQLADEAGFMDSWFSESGDDCERELKKFAELIVAECIGIVANQGAYMRYDSLVTKMRKHFGVEE